ncbi:putative Cytoplasmic polyadenylation element binding protein CPEB2 [Aphelenchoides fujianensis]|nr:putative Cytoplasmic polyadenylation element binding protein CPEB2 [Aphelenchoides fujianensis]
MMHFWQAPVPMMPPPLQGGPRFGPLPPLQALQHPPPPPSSMRPYSLKLFVGAIPQEADERTLVHAFRPFGLADFWWPGRHDGKPIPGYAFATFRRYQDVGYLLSVCDHHCGRFSFYLGHGKTMVEIRPFGLSDASHILEPLWARFVRLSIFVGGIPRTVTASELAHLVAGKFGQVLHCSLELEYPHKYPKGAGRVVFRHIRSYVNAAQAGRVVLDFAEGQRSVEIKPYVYKEMPCEKCFKEVQQQTKFCSVCLQYYCHACWTEAHQFANPPHQPLMCSPRNLPNLGV